MHLILYLFYLFKAQHCITFDLVPLSPSHDYEQFSMVHLLV